MDLQHLVDRLEDLIDEGRHIPMSKFTLIDEERALEIIDQMRISIPEEIEKAQRVLAHRDRILQQANEEAERLIATARERSDQLVDREAMVQAAQNRATNIIEAARQDAEGITGDANDYVVETLSALEQRLLKLISEVRNGIDFQQRQAAGAPTAVGTAVPVSQFAPPRPQQTVDAKPQPPKAGEASG
jgi:multidrug efflux pump subunit AcrA (membrane-fusion protein)